MSSGGFWDEVSKAEKTKFWRSLEPGNLRIVRLLYRRLNAIYKIVFNLPYLIVNLRSLLL